MKNPNFIRYVAFAGALLSVVSAVQAGKGHDHAGHDGHGAHAARAADTASSLAAMNSHDAMIALIKHLGEMETELAAGKLDGIHDHFDAIAASVKDLDKDTSLTADKKKRVQGYVKNVLKLADKVHHSADGGKPDQAKKDFVKLKAQVDLLDKQFAHSHKPHSHKPGGEKPKANEGHKTNEGHSHGAK